MPCGGSSGEPPCDADLDTQRGPRAPSVVWLALLSLIPQVVRLLLRSQTGRSRPLTGAPISGAGAFVPIASGIGAAVGLVVGWLSPTHPVWLVALVYWVVGSLYGLLAWRLARAGLLMPPEGT